MNIINDKYDEYLLQTKIQFNNDNKRQNILRERNILYIRKQTHGSPKIKAYWAEMCSARKSG